MAEQARSTETNIQEMLLKIVNKLDKSEQEREQDRIHTKQEFQDIRADRERDRQEFKQRFQDMEENLNKRMDRTDEQFEKFKSEIKQDLKVECQQVRDQMQGETKRMGKILNTKIDTEITVLETKLKQIKNQIDQELVKQKESVEAKCDQVVEKMSEFREVMEEVLAINEDNTAKTNSKFQVAEVNLEKYKEMVAQTVKTKCEEVSRRLGERLAMLESNNNELDSKIEKLREMQ
jgi:hypothetical protein